MGYPVNEEAYLTFAKSMAILFGADPNRAETEMSQVLEFQRKLRSVSRLDQGIIKCIQHSCLSDTFCSSIIIYL